MNNSDPIVDEVRRVRNAHAAKFNYDAKAIFRDIKEQEKRSGRKYVSFADESVEPIQALHPPGLASAVPEEIPSQPGGPAADG